MTRDLSNRGPSRETVHAASRTGRRVSCDWGR
jgi:hypothetical protein